MKEDMEINYVKIPDWKTHTSCEILLPNPMIPNSNSKAYSRHYGVRDSARFESKVSVSIFRRTGIPCSLGDEGVFERVM